MAIDQRVASAELDRLAEGLAPPCQIGEYSLEGLISKTSTALIFVARGGAFGQARDGVLKLTGAEYAALLEFARFCPVTSTPSWFACSARAPRFNVLNSPRINQPIAS